MQVKHTFLPFLLTLIVALSGLSIDIYLPSLPAIAKDLQTSLVHVQLSLNAFMIGFAFCMLFSGPLSDCFGRRKIILIGFFLYFIATLFCLFSISIEQFIIGRFFQALGGCCGTVIARIIVRDLYEAKKAIKVLAYIASGIAITPIIAPILGSLIQTYFNWRINFAILAVLSLTLLIMIYFYLNETIQRRNKKALNFIELFKNYKLAFHDKNYLIYTMVISFSWAGYFAFITGSVFIFMVQLKMSSIHYGIIYSLIVSSYIAGTFVASLLAARYSTSIIVMIASFIISLAGIIFFILNFYFPSSIINIMFPMIIYLICLGIIMPNAQAGALESFNFIAGSVAGLLYFIEMLFGVVSGILTTHFANHPFSLPWIILCCALSVSLSYLFVRFPPFISIKNIQ